MNSADIWLRWVREGSAYTITKSRREAVRLARIEVLYLFLGYAAEYIEKRIERNDPMFEYDLYDKNNIQPGCGKILENDYELGYILDEFCEDLLNEYNPFDEYPTLKRFLFYACDIASSLRMYVSVKMPGMKEIGKRMIRRRMEALHSPFAGAIARRAFVEVEKALRDMTEPEIEEEDE